jgi:hypothetical protein
MRKEYDFSKGVRGKFYRPNVELNLPIYLEPDVAKFVRELARAKDTAIEAIVNSWLRQDIRHYSDLIYVNPERAELAEW